MAEQVLWKQLRGSKLGVHFRRQHVVGMYIVDFVSLKNKLVIEVDGGYHFSHEQMELDAYRTEDLEKLGFKVLRFRNENVIRDIELVLKTIQVYINGNTN